MMRVTPSPPSAASLSWHRRRPPAPPPHSLSQCIPIQRRHWNCLSHYPWTTVGKVIQVRLATPGELYPMKYDDDYRQAVEAFIKLSCHLRELTLADFTIEQAKPLTHSFTHLEKLCIDDQSCHELLNVKKLRSTAFPNLRILTLICNFSKDLAKMLTRILGFRNGVYIGRLSIRWPLEKIIKPKGDLFPFKEAISDWQHSKLTFSSINSKYSSFLRV